MNTESQKTSDSTLKPVNLQSEKTATDDKVIEIGGAKGPEPTRYGDWEKNGRCIDF